MQVGQDALDVELPSPLNPKDSTLFNPEAWGLRFNVVVVAGEDRVEDVQWVGVQDVWFRSWSSGVWVQSLGFRGEGATPSSFRVSSEWKCEMRESSNRSSCVTRMQKESVQNRDAFTSGLLCSKFYSSRQD